MPAPLTMEQKIAKAESKKSAVKDTVRTETDRPKRSKRVPVGIPRQKLSVSHEIPGYRLYWFNDVPGRISEAEAGGYTFVDEKEIALNDFVTLGNADLGTKVKRLVGKNEDGSALYAYLMKIELDLFEEDQKEIQARVDATDASIRAGKLSSSDHQYVPSSGITYKS